MMVKKFEVVRSEWENANGDLYWTITDGVTEKGEFASFEEADENMLSVIENWGRDS